MCVNCIVSLFRKFGGRSIVSLWLSKMTKMWAFFWKEVRGLWAAVVGTDLGYANETIFKGSFIKVFNENYQMKKEEKV